LRFVKQLIVLDNVFISTSYWWFNYTGYIFILYFLYGY